jgi:hypothetical protein
VISRAPKKQQAETCEDADRSDGSGHRYDEPGHCIGDNISLFDASCSWPIPHNPGDINQAQRLLQDPADFPKGILINRPHLRPNSVTNDGIGKRRAGSSTPSPR